MINEYLLCVTCVTALPAVLLMHRKLKVTHQMSPDSWMQVAAWAKELQRLTDSACKTACPVLLQNAHMALPWVADIGYSNPLL